MGGEDLLLVYEVHSGVEHVVILHKIRDASVDVHELAVDIVKLGENILGEVIEELMNLHSISHGNGEWIKPVSRYQVSGVRLWWPLTVRLGWWC